MSLTVFRRALQQHPLDLTQTALQFAQSIAYPELDIREQLNILNRIVANARSAEIDTLAPDVQPVRLARYLFEEERFQGNQTAYQDPDNSYLNCVLARRLGIPISLSVVYIAIAQALGMTAYGVGLPGHFVVGVSTPSKTVYIDPFHGNVLTGEQCVALVRHTTGYRGAVRAEWFDPTPLPDIILRMLNNLRIVYLRNQDWTLARRTLMHINAVRPDLPETSRDLGLVAYAEQDFIAASQHLDSYLTNQPQATDGDVLKKTVGPPLPTGRD